MASVVISAGISVVGVVVSVVTSKPLGSPALLCFSVVVIFTPKSASVTSAASVMASVGLIVLTASVDVALVEVSHGLKGQSYFSSSFPRHCPPFLAGMITFRVLDLNAESPQVLEQGDL